jgi:anti-anti-sigma factor
MATVVGKDERGVLVLALLKGFMEDTRLAEFPGAYKPALEPGKRLVLDLSELDYIDSGHLGALVRCYKQVSDAGGVVVFCGLKPAVRETFLVTRLDRVLKIVSTRGEAIRQLADESSPT